ncbi:MAG: hypothetical protein LBM17_07770, partial [Candidatus Accumulibacter sp.]|nr:hypothetical protein [Accumulibacter sp.]
MKRLMILLSLLVVLSGVYFYSRRPPTEAQKTENDAQSAKEDAAAQADIKHMLETRRPLTPEEEAQRAAEDAAAQADAKRMLENVIRESEYLMSLPPEEKEIVLLKRRSEDLTAPPYPDLEMEPKDSQPPTAWREAEMKRYAALFDGAKVDLLIVPFQVQGYGISRTHRSLMSALLSSTLSRSVKVANPYLLARALGDTDRRIDRGAVFRLASRVGAKRILWTYAGHRDAASLDLYFQFQEPGKDGSFSETPDLPGKAIANIAFDDENPPVLAFRKNLAKIVETLGYAFSEVPTLAAKDLESAIPADFTAILRPEDPANSALQLQMLAHLLPEDAYRAKLRLFERSLLLAWQLPPEHPATRQILARAYYSIGMRLPALAAIKSPQNDVEHALVALLNGNLPDLENHRARIQNSPQRLMAEIDVSDVRYAYEKPPGEDTRSFQDKLPEPLIHFFERRIEDGDPVKLHRFSNFQVLRVLGEEFPSAGQGIVQMLRRKLAAVQRMGSEEVDMLLENYLKPTLALADASSYNTSMSWGPHRLDVLEFLTQSGLSNLIYAADRMARSQAVYNSAIGYIKGIGPLFGSHPEILSARAYAEYHGPIQQLSGEARKDLYAQYAKNVHMSGYWKHMSYDYLSSDRPSSSLANITYGAYRLKNLFQATRNVTLKERLLKETEGRLDGSGVREILAVDLYEAQGNMQAAKTALQDFVKTKPTDFIAYNRLGEFLIKEGEYRQAADVFETFPGLDKEGRSVTSDNHAYDIASRFFWMGENELAKPFFKIAAASHTGSGASMMSAVRLSLIDGDYSDAMRRLYGAVRRYPLSQRYNDYFSLLHVFGASQAAWDGFLVVVANSSEPHVWDSLLVGHRRLRYSDEKIVDWLKQPPLEGKTGM